MRRSDGLPAIIAHRGASGYRPEHTLASYQLAIELGADYIEPDVVSTSDGFLVARHENQLSETTDVATRAEFADRYTTKVVDGVEKSGWFVEDFTLDEIRSLRAKERLAELRPGNTRFDGQFLIPTLEEILVMLRAENAQRAKNVGIYIETKHPTYFAKLGLDLTQPLFDLLDTYRPELGVIQSFESENLSKMDNQWPRIRLMDKDEDIAMFDFADGIGPAKSLVISDEGETTSLVNQAHDLGMEVHVWTMRNEDVFLPPRLRATPANPHPQGAIDEYFSLFDCDVDAVFSDFTDTALVARSLWAERNLD